MDPDQNTQSDSNNTNPLNPTPTPPTSSQPEATPQVVTSPSSGADSGVTNPPAAAQSPQPSSSQMQSSPKGSKKKLIILIVAIVVGLAVITGGTLLALKMLDGVKLEQINGDGYSVLIPKDYEKTDLTYYTQYEEKGGDKDTHSGVIVAKVDLPQMTAEQKKELESNFEEQFKSFSDSMTRGNQKVESSEVTKVKHNGQDALQMKATINEDGKKAGTLQALGIIRDDAIYVVVVAAHVSDPGVAKKMDTIIKSFSIK